MRCPVCRDVLSILPGHSPDGRTGAGVLGCGTGHRFDVARQGQVVLVSGGSKLRADTTDMVAARVRVLASGALDVVRDALLAAAASLTEAGEDGLVVDLGAGTGAYTAAVLDVLPRHHGLALELSTPALRVAAQAHPRLAAVGADLTRPLPLADGAVGAGSAVVAVFAPLPAADELRRVTRAGAGLVVVTPTPAHLAGLRGRLGLLDVPAGKPERVQARLGPTWAPTGRTDVSATTVLDRERAVDVVAMGPNAWHTDDRLRAALSDLPGTVQDTVAVTVSAFRRT